MNIILKQLDGQPNGGGSSTTKYDDIVFNQFAIQLNKFQIQAYKFKVFSI